MRSIRILLLLVFLAVLVPLPVRAQAPALSPEVAAILNSMTPEERVGQLFLVSFNGTDTSETSQIYNLMTQYHVGGVVMLAQNDNFVPAPDTVSQAHALINNIQQLEWNTSINPVINSATGLIVESAYIPLLVGVAQEGNGYPTDQILSGLTPLPSEMAIGATWSPELASQVGEVRGRELAALGFNLYLGPSLDVLEVPAVSGGDLGTRVFGGDPFWVGEMGRAYVAGLHNGSNNELLVVAKHFPGVGGSDRLPEEEVSTVRKSIEQLKQIELYPFFSVTGNALTPESTVDGLLVSHIRYQGFQGNIRATTRPISLDPQALSQILALPQFSAWQSNGGLVISDDLGTRAVNEFYTTGGGQFSARTAARDAFLAGNDMLYLGNIISSDFSDTYTTTTRVIEFFAQKYREDSAFAQRVDSSVARILAVKLGMYDGVFTLSNVTTSASQLTGLGTATEATFDVARHSATLISPDKQDLTTVMPLPPQADESMIFLTDTVTTKQCSACAEQPVLAMDALQQAVIQLYGPQSGNQTNNFRLASYSFQNLQSLLDDQEVPFIKDDITRANWVIISLTDATQGQPALISRFLRERSDLLRGKRVILFSFGAPYYFDTTTISKFTAYYALYSKQPQFVDVAARLLFQELTPVGASPVSISAVGYDLISVTSPNPSQVIPLSLDSKPIPAGTGLPTTPEPTQIPLFIGDTIAIRTGAIMDNNGNPVPDGTVVQFSMMLTGEGGGILQQVDAVTTQGVARASFGLDKPGLLEIKVTSYPAVNSQVLRLDVSQSGAIAVIVVTPELTQVREPTPQPTVIVEEDNYISPEGSPRFSAWLVAMLFIAFSIWVGYGTGVRVVTRRSAFRWALGIALGGLAAYNYLIFGLFGIMSWLTTSGLSGVIVFVFMGELLGFAAGWFWSRK